MVFERASLARDGVIAYFDHELWVDELPDVIAACRAVLKESIGGTSKPPL